MAGADFFDITVKGRGSHGRAAAGMRDPIIAITAIAQAMQTIVSRNVHPQQAAVVSVDADPRRRRL